MKAMNFKCITILIALLALIPGCKKKIEKENTKPGPSWTTYTTEDGLAANGVSDIAIDKEGNAWFGTYHGFVGGGVSKFDGNTWINYTEADGLVSNAVTDITVDKEGNMWFGTNNYSTGGQWPGSIYITGGVSKFDGTTWTTFNTSNGLTNENVMALAIDQEGNKWFGTLGGVIKFDGTTWTTYTTEDGLVTNFIRAIAIDNEGNKWLATPYGVSKFDGKTWTTYTTEDGLVTNDIYTIAIDKEGNLWFGNQGSISEINVLKGWCSDPYTVGATKFDGKTWKSYYPPNSYDFECIHEIAVDAEGNKWFGTPNGILKFDGSTWTHYTTSDGLVNNLVTAIVIDAQGNKWFGTDKGVSKLSGD
jgi:ligand-binding sensor domain-containing protein